MCERGQAPWGFSQGCQGFRPPPTPSHLQPGPWVTTPVSPTPSPENPAGHPGGRGRAGHREGWCGRPRAGAVGMRSRTVSAAAAEVQSPALSDGHLPSAGTGAQGSMAGHGETCTRTTAASRRRDLGGT